MKAKTITATILIAVFLISAIASVPTVSAPGVKKADLSITKIGSKSSAYVGDTITYTYTVYNAGPDKAQKPVQVIDDKLGTFTYMDDRGHPIDLDVGDTWTFIVSYTILGTDPDPLVNLATVASKTDDPNMDNNVASWSVDILPPPPTTVTVTFDQSGVGTDFTGTVLTVDGTNYGVADLPVVFTWTVGSSHTFAYLSPLVVNESTQYLWASTSGLSTEQSGTLTATETGTVTGHYALQYTPPPLPPPPPPPPPTPVYYTLTIVSHTGGSVNSTGGSFEEGIEITLLATPDANYTFTNWKINDVNETTNPITITMDADYTVEAFFEAIPPTPPPPTPPPPPPTPPTPPPTSPTTPPTPLIYVELPEHVSARENATKILATLGDAVFTGINVTNANRELDCNHDKIIDIADAWCKLNSVGLVGAPTFAFEPGAAQKFLTILQQQYGPSLENYPTIDGRVWLLYMLAYAPYH